MLQNKEKESKIKQLHQFVAVSFSNAAVCDMCHKPMTNKPALRCESKRRELGGVCVQVPKYVCCCVTPQAI